MAKTNFSKVEDLLQTSMTKMEVEQWGKLADIAQKVERPEMRKLVERATLAAEKAALDKKALIHALKRAKKDFKEPEFYEAIGIQAEELDALLKNSKELKPEEWTRLQEVRSRVVAYKKKKSEAHESKNEDHAIVEQERHKHVNKRFNVRDKWLPLK